MNELLLHRRALMMTQEKHLLWDMSKRKQASNEGSLLRKNWNNISTKCYYVPSTGDGYGYYSPSNVIVGKNSVKLTNNNSTMSGVAFPFLLKPNTSYKIYFSATGGTASRLLYNADGSYRTYAWVSSGSHHQTDESGRLLFCLIGKGEVEFTDIYLEEVI